MASEDTRERAHLRRLNDKFAAQLVHVDNEERHGAFTGHELHVLNQAIDAVLAVVSPSPVDAERPERWMVDYEHAEGEPQHTVLSWLDDEAKGLPDVGEYLIRESDAGRLAAAPPAGVIHPTLQATVNRLIANGNAAGVASLLEDEWGILAQTNVKLDTALYAPPVGVDEDARAVAARDRILQWIRESKERVLGGDLDDLVGVFEFALTQDEQGPWPGTPEWWQRAETDSLELCRIVLRAAGLPSSAAPGVTEADVQGYVALLHDRTRHAMGLMRSMIASGEPMSLVAEREIKEGFESQAILAALAVSPAPPKDGLREAALAVLNSASRDSRMPRRFRVVSNTALEALEAALTAAPAPTEGPGL